MPMIDIQRQLVELGRIRTGDQVAIPGRPGKTRPRRLETFRLTSDRRDLLEQAAKLYGGTPKAWGDQWELVIESETLPIMLPPGEALSQWYEMWSGGGCQRRCDGARQVLNDQPCACPADKAERAQLAAQGEACKPTTRVNLMLHELPGLGVWRLESHGYYAAVELAGAAEYLSMATSVGHRIPAHLRIVQRTVKRPTVGKDGKPTVQTRHFAVPTIDIDQRPIDVLAGMQAQAQIAAPVERMLPAGPVNRRERVERPDLPGGEPLPGEANLERPSNPPLGEQPALPEDASFRDIEEDDAEEEEEHVPPIEKWAKDAGYDARYVHQVAAAMFPGRTWRQLTGEDRANLLVALAAPIHAPDEAQAEAGTPPSLASGGPSAGSPEAQPAVTAAEEDMGTSQAAQGEAVAGNPAASPDLCGAASPYGPESKPCSEPAGHAPKTWHRNDDRETWT